MPTGADPAVELRVPEPADAARWFAVFDDADVMRYIGSGAIRDAAWYESFVDRQRACFIATGYCLFAVTVDGEVAGFAGLQPWTNDWGPVGRVEIGWRLGRSFWGRGIALKAAGQALLLGPERGVPDPVAVIHTGNVRSVSLAERLGMTRSGVLDAPGGVRAYLYEPSRPGELSRPDKPAR